MFVRASTVILAIAASTIAAPASSTSTTTSQCDTGSLQCCNQTMNESDAASLLGLLGILGSVEGMIGLGCSPVGIGSGAVCQQQPVCCTNVSENGLINLGCSPVNVNL